MPSLKTVLEIQLQGIIFRLLARLVVPYQPEIRIWEYRRIGWCDRNVEAITPLVVERVVSRVDCPHYGVL
jgi:hypothetical protein